MKKKSFALAAALLTFAQAYADAARKEGGGDRSLLTNRTVQELEKRALQGDWEGLLTASRRVIEDGLTAGGTYGLDAGLAYLALAEAGLGREEEAIWHWWMAQSFNRWLPGPKRLARYGAPGELLKRHRLRQPEASPEGMTVRQAGELQAPAEPAKRIQGEVPPLPAAVKAISLPQWVRVEAIVDEEGRLRQPVIRAAGTLGIAYVVLEAMRTWRFEPAREQGRPVPVFYELTVGGPEERPLDTMVRLEGAFLAIERALRASDWRKARDRALNLWIWAIDQADQSPEFFGVVMTLQALAEAGLGREGPAACRWQAAQGFAPALFHADLSAYGPAGELLEANRWGWTLAESRSQVEPGPGLQGEDHVEKPEILEKRQPYYPSFATLRGIEDQVVLEGVITEEGYFQHLIALAPGRSRSLTASALDAACDWRFQPATYRGKPVKVFYSLTVNFKTRGRR